MADDKNQDLPLFADQVKGDDHPASGRGADLGLQPGVAADDDTEKVPYFTEPWQEGYLDKSGNYTAVEQPASGEEKAAQESDSKPAPRASKGRSKDA